MRKRKLTKKAKESDSDETSQSDEKPKDVDEVENLPATQEYPAAAEPAGDDLPDNPNGPKYSKMWYKGPLAYGIRQCFGEKRQICQLKCSRMTKETFAALAILRFRRFGAVSCGSLLLHLVEIH